MGEEKGEERKTVRMKCGGRESEVKGLDEWGGNLPWDGVNGRDQQRKDPPVHHTSKLQGQPGIQSAKNSACNSGKKNPGDRAKSRANDSLFQEDGPAGKRFPLKKHNRNFPFPVEPGE